MSNAEVLLKMQAKGFNITTCGKCGAIRLHQTGIDELTCEDCGLTSDICDFPDLFITKGEK